MAFATHLIFISLATLLLYYHSNKPGFYEKTSQFIAGMFIDETQEGNVTLKLSLNNFLPNIIESALTVFQTQLGELLVGIGKDEPQCKLDVAGSICADRYINNQCDISQRVCETPLAAVVPLTSVLSVYIESADKTIVSTPSSSGDSFGSSVDVLNDILISGATRVSLPDFTPQPSGAAYVFYKDVQNGSVIWIQGQQLKPFSSTTNEVKNSEFGSKVKLFLHVDTNTYYALVSAHFFTTMSPTRSNAGGIFVFKQNDTVILNGIPYPSFVPHQKIVSPTPRSNGRFGQSFDINNHLNQLIIGEPFQSSGSGLIYIYSFSNTTTLFSQITNSPLSCNYNLNNNLCGESISASHNGISLLAVGVPGYTSGEGSVEIYSWNNSTLSYNYIQSLYSDNPVSTDQFGFQLTLSSTLKWLFVSAPYTDYNGFTNVGYVYDYQWNGTHYIRWNSVLSLPLTPIENNEYFGWSIDCSANEQYLIIGCPGFGSSTANSGAAFIYQWSETLQLWNTSYNMIQATPVSQTNSLFGESVYINNDYAAIGAPIYERSQGIISGIVQISYNLISLKYFLNTQCLLKRDTLPTILNTVCSFTMSPSIPSGTYLVTTNTSILNIPATMITNIFYEFSLYGLTVYDQSYDISFFQPQIPEEDIFTFVIISHYHTNVIVTLETNLFLGNIP